MNHHEEYFFDLRRYLVVRNALTADQVAALSEQLDRVHKAVKRHYGSDRTRLPDDADRAWSSASLLEWGGAYIDLIDLPTIAPYLEELLGAGYRFDHDYLNVNNATNHRSLHLLGGGQGAGIFYKYTPHAAAWSPCYYNADHYGDLSDRQRAMLMPPSVYGPAERTRAICSRAQAEQAELMRLREKIAALKGSARARLHGE